MKYNYVFKYAIKNLNAVDNIAALALSSYTKKLETEKELKDGGTKTQLVFGRITSMAYAKSNLNEVCAVTAAIICFTVQRL